MRDLVAEEGRTYAEQAGITLRDEPAPLFQLLVLTTLASTRISADVAAAAAHELFAAGWRTPQRLLDSTWRQRVDALGRGGYRRYDERTATVLAESATLLLEEHGGDLRRLRPSTADEVPELVTRLQDFPRVGPTGARIFCREVQAVWPAVRPFFDDRALATAGRLGLPEDAVRLGATVADDDVVRLASALVRRGTR